VIEGVERADSETQVMALAVRPSKERNPEIAIGFKVQRRIGAGIFVCMVVNPPEKLPRLASYGVL